ncbi:receptor-interacting serine/threonine-protein kinase 1 isoform 2-T3 [Discoglossus pictus]
MSLDDILMRSEDLIDQEQIDAGGFGMVSLCVHRRHGLVVTKTVCTGSKHVMYNDALMAEGKIMRKLSHERVVKLLGVIVEEGNCSLVMEYMKKGNLLTVLRQVQAPLSVKGRFILEIIEGMTYLHEQNVVHKDLKPENVLVDDDFHIKIADLGVAAFKTWSKLTKEETDRKRKSNNVNGTKTKNNAGTLIYMAPEHLRSLNKKPTEKSDIYSFSIVIWVILTNREPYEHALSNEQIQICVTNGERPSLEELPDESPPEALDLMQQCWLENPDDRPTFKDCDKKFRSFYTSKQVKNIEKDIAKIKREFPKPQAFVERMQSLQLDCDAEPPSVQTRDQPQSLHSSQGLSSTNLLEELFLPVPNEPVESEDPKLDDTLERKLEEEMRYHQAGSRLDNGMSLQSSQSTSVAGIRSRKVFNEFTEASARQPSTPSPLGVSEKQTELLVPSNHGNVPSPDIYCSDVSPEFQPYPAHQNDPSNSPWAYGGQNNLYRMPGPASFPHHLDRMAQCNSGSFPSPGPHKAPIPESGISDHYQQQPKHLFPGDMGYGGESSVSVNIVNSSAVQIGNYNTLSIEKAKPMHLNPGRSNSYYEKSGVLESTALVNENHLELLRENLSTKWKRFARKLGFRHPEIEEIDHDYDKDGLKEKVYQTLYKWRMKEGSKNATVGKVASALYSMGEMELLSAFIAVEQI